MTPTVSDIMAKTLLSKMYFEYVFFGNADFYGFDNSANKSSNVSVRNSKSYSPSDIVIFLIKTNNNL